MIRSFSLLALFLCSQAFAETTIIPRSQVMNQRYDRIQAMTGQYEIEKTKEDGECVEKPQLKIEMHGKVPVLYLGSQLKFPIASLTKTASAKKTDCIQVKYNSFNDMNGWIEERQTGICSGRKVGQRYKKIAFDFEEQTIRVLTKVNGRTDVLCQWRRTDSI